MSKRGCLASLSRFLRLSERKPAGSLWDPKNRRPSANLPPSEDDKGIIHLLVQLPSCHKPGQPHQPLWLGQTTAPGRFGWVRGLLREWLWVPFPTPIPIFPVLIISYLAIFLSLSCLWKPSSKSSPLQDTFPNIPYSFNNYSSSIYYTSGTIIGARDINKASSLTVFTFWGRDKQLTNTKIYKVLPGVDKRYAEE